MYQLALIVRNIHPSVDGHQVLVVPVLRPPLPKEYAGLNYRDSDLWDLPFAPLCPVVPCAKTAPVGIVPSNGATREEENEDEGSRSSLQIAQDVQSDLDKLGLKGLDITDCIRKIKMQIFPFWNVMQPWNYWKVMEEPEYGPESPINTVIFVTEVQLHMTCLSGAAQWLGPQAARELLVGADVRQKRLGPLAAFVFSSHPPNNILNKFNLNVLGQEYPPGVLMVPMDSWTLKPFNKTNLVIFASSQTSEKYNSNDFAVARGDALIMDPGCHPVQAQAQLSKIISSLPDRLLIFLTHHHLDHTEGLPIVRQHNSQAVLIAHEVTIRRMGKAAQLFKCVPVVDGSKLLVGDHELLAVAAPGHTDGHMALLHQPTHTLVVGDHCVGHGSSVLDSESGGNMQDYLATTYQFLDLAPRIIVPMHGRFNLWPAHMLCGYIRHREAREAKVLEAIENGAQTAYEIVSQAYSDTVPGLWMGAVSNVKLHVEHLADLQKLPLNFSMRAFRHSCGFGFWQRCLLMIIWHSLFHNTNQFKVLLSSTLGIASLLVLVGVILYFL